MNNKIRLLCIAFTLSFSCNFQYGFSTTYMNAPVDVFRKYLNDSAIRRGFTLDDNAYIWIWNTIANAWFVGLFFGIWLSPLLCSMATAVVGQALILYLQECAPTSLRGFIAYTSEIGFSAMTLLGMFLSMESIWGRNLTFLTGFAIIPGIFAVLVLFPMHETPKFLYISRQNKSATIDAIRFYHGADADTDTVLHELKQESNFCQNDDVSLKKIFTIPHIRKAIFLGCLALQNTLAIWAILVSSTHFLKQVNLKTEIAQWSSTGITLCYFIGTVSGSNFIEKFGRRSMTLIFGSLCTAALLCYVIFAQLQPVFPILKYCCLVSLLFFGLLYGFGIGPIPWFLSSELVPQKYRSLVQSTCFTINTVMVVVSTFTILPLYNVIGSFAFLILYVFPSIIAITILYFYLPETKGRPIYEIVDDLCGESGPISANSAL